MNFWNIVKYAIFVLFFLVMIVGFSLHYSQEDTAQAPQTVTNQSKFNL